jgi:hypothetical protein
MKLQSNIVVPHSFRIFTEPSGIERISQQVYSIEADIPLQVESRTY